MEQQLVEYLKKGLIQPIFSPWALSILLVKKKDGSMWMCLDYSFLNQIRIKNTYSMLHIDELFGQLKGTKYFLKIDLRSRYH